MVPLLILILCFGSASNQNLGRAPTSLSELSGENLVNYINSAQSEFVAENNDFHKRYPAMHKKYAAANPDQDEEIPVENATLSKLPSHFDSRERWPHCGSMRYIRDQGHCGSCWAFAVAEVISDRTCIRTRGADSPILSAEDILTCCGKQCGSGCDGGYPVEALKWWRNKGVVTGGDYGGEGCEPYSIRPALEEAFGMATPRCKKYCQKRYHKKYLKDKRHGESVYKMSRNSKAIMSEIFLNGPVTATFEVYEDLYKYRHGIYHHVGGKHLGAHAVKIIGWGTENHQDYWIIANSWGVHFGERGFMRVRRGNNECGIEGEVLAGRARNRGKEDSVEEETSNETEDLSSAELQFL